MNSLFGISVSLISVLLFIRQASDLSDTKTKRILQREIFLEFNYA